MLRAPRPHAAPRYGRPVIGASAGGPDARREPAGRTARLCCRRRSAATSVRSGPRAHTAPHRPDAPTDVERAA